jgi:hypothetical protein
MMRCRDVRRLSSRYLEGDLPSHRASAARGHLRDCVACREALEDEARLAEAALALSDAGEPAGGWGALWSRVEVRLAEEERADAARPGWALWWRAKQPALTMAIAAAAAAALVLAISPRLGSSGGRELSEGHASSAGPAEPERFLERAEREVVRADRRYAAAVAELRELAGTERGHWPPGRRAELDAKLAELDARIAHARRQLAVMGIPEPHARDELCGIYREQISVLQRAVVGAPLAAVAAQPGARPRP